MKIPTERTMRSQRQMRTARLVDTGHTCASPTILSTVSVSSRKRSATVRPIFSQMLDHLLIQRDFQHILGEQLQQQLFSG